MTATATILGPVLALFTIIGAMGNGPLAAVLWENEVMFAGIIGFLYADYVIEHGRPRLAHVNVKANPTANWTLQQLREVVGDLHVHRYLIHDRDRIFAKHLDDSIRALGLEVLKSPVASPEANAICERVIGTIRRECLDWPIPVWEPHLRAILKEWVAHYNGPLSRRVGTRRSGSAKGIGAGPEVRTPTSIGGGCARARQIDPGRIAS